MNIKYFNLKIIGLYLLSAFPLSSYAQTSKTETSSPLAQQTAEVLPTVTVVGSAAQAGKQMPGVSIITHEDIEHKPISRDVNEIIRTMPGVNLTGNSNSGQRGNNRQIDIRGMGPENTLILIDGKPANSRNSIRYGRGGERDTRGDTNWVPADEIEKIEVIRGPAAARYGSGSAGGVVNIITKGTSDKFHANISLYMNKPQHSAEGANKRATFGISGPIADNLNFRIYGNVDKNEADDWDINKKYFLHNPNAGKSGQSSWGKKPAGREGVRNRNIASRFSWAFLPGQRLDFDASFSRQGNIYAGDTQNNNSNTIVDDKYGHETNTLYRENYALTHHGQYDIGNSLAYIQYTSTRNQRIDEGLAGGTEGIFQPETRGSSSPLGSSTSRLKELTFHGEFNLPINLAFEQVITFGIEAGRQRLHDSNSTSFKMMDSPKGPGGSSSGRQRQKGGGIIPGLSNNRNANTKAHNYAFFIEDNIQLTDSTLLTPALRYDYYSETAGNWSPSINLLQEINDQWSVKLGIAQAYKAPNLYQTNKNYLLYSAGNSCKGNTGDSYGCYLLGSKHLDAETSINKELGVEYHTHNLLAGLTWFRNDYHDKIEAGSNPVALTSTGTHIYRWENIHRAVVEGFEGTFNYDFTEYLKLTNNFTVMTQTKRKKDSKHNTQNDVLSVIPKFTINSGINWDVNDQLGLGLSATYYGTQKPKRYNFLGDRASGSEKSKVSPYAVFNLRGNYQITKNYAVNAGITNLFDKRQFRQGNAQSVNYISGAGAHTYNESGRTFYLSVKANY